MSEEQPKQLARKLVSTLWFPMFFIVGFMVCYLLPFHAPQPRDMPVAVVGEQSAERLDTTLNRSVPDGFDVMAVSDEQAAKQSIDDREATAAYDPADGELFYGSANGKASMQMLRQVFAPVAQQSGQQLTTTDLVPTAAGDVMGTGLFYCLMAINIPPYIAVMMLLRAELTTRQKLGSLVGVGALGTVIAYAAGVSLDVVHNDPLVLLVGFLLTQAVAWTTFGLVPFVKQFIPGVAMGLFVLLSIPSSGGAIPKELVPGFFQSLHLVMPLGQAVHAVRGILYFDGTGALGATLGLSAWVLLGVALVVLNQVLVRRRSRTAAAEESTADTGGGYEHADDGDVTVDPVLEAPEPVRHRTLAGSVTDGSGAAVPGASVTVTDGRGVQLARMLTSPDGTYKVQELPEEPVTVVASASRMQPAVDRLTARSGRVERCDFLLDPEAGSHSVRPSRVDASMAGRS
ncbi:carboxypeptidase regulatory-like domain-containing protein [Actinopolyspora halophila]|uniref:carboxypeptidase regulatory-like domain-containing protein n=1 Tax=Actinopolyspora halophila TaxID=1850 RepID=UPI00039C6820|nr:carboxypeptidase regulatory-like domain-containing protein [Actinopolyspora halophila]